MITLKEHIFEKLKVTTTSQNVEDFADAIISAGGIGDVRERVDGGAIYLRYTNFKDKAKKVLCTLEILEEPGRNVALYTVIFNDNDFEDFKSEDLYDNDMQMYRCPLKIRNKLAKACFDPPRVFFMYPVTDWYENTNYSKTDMYDNIKKDIYKSLQ